MRFEPSTTRWKEAGSFDDKEGIRIVNLGVSTHDKESSFRLEATKPKVEKKSALSVLFGCCGSTPPKSYTDILEFHKYDSPEIQGTLSKSVKVSDQYRITFDNQALKSVNTKYVLLMRAILAVLGKK